MTATETLALIASGAIGAAFVFVVVAIVAAALIYMDRGKK